MSQGILVNERLLEILSLGSGWYFGTGGSYRREDLLFVQELMERLIREPRVYPNPEEEDVLVLEWSLPNHELALDFNVKSRRADVMLVDIRTHEYEEIVLDLTTTENMERLNETLRSSS